MSYAKRQSSLLIALIFMLLIGATCLSAENGDDVETCPDGYQPCAPGCCPA